MGRLFDFSGFYIVKPNYRILSSSAYVNWTAPGHPWSNERIGSSLMWHGEDPKRRFIVRFNLNRLFEMDGPMILLQYWRLERSRNLHTLPLPLYSDFRGFLASLSSSAFSFSGQTIRSRLLTRHRLSPLQLQLLSTLPSIFAPGLPSLSPSLPASGLADLLWIVSLPLSPAHGYCLAPSSPSEPVSRDGNSLYRSDSIFR